MAACSTLIAFVAPAQNQPSAKNSAAVSDVHVLKKTSSAQSPYIGPWERILATSLKTANQKDLQIGVSLEVGLVTSTLVVSSGGVSDSSEAKGKVEIRILVDGKAAAFPGDVVFARRSQKMTAVFAGIDRCTKTNADMTVTVDENCMTPESLDLVLDTMNANSFNFIVPDLLSGYHTIEVQARINLEATADQGSAEARAYLGRGSVTVEEIRLVRNSVIEMQ